MKHFILEDNFINSIRKNINNLKLFYETNIEKLFFYNFEYEDYYLSVLHPKERNIDLKKLRESNFLFKDIFCSNMDLIVPSTIISRMLPRPKMNSFIAHKHLYDIDLKIYHLIMKCNDRCGMIIEDEYLSYETDLIFGFNADKEHIAFNFGETIKDSFEFIILNPKYSLENWLDIKIKEAINSDYAFLETDKTEALKKIKKFTNF